MLNPFKLINYSMTLYELRSDLRMTTDDFIIEFGQIALDMAASQGNRIERFSKHTATTIHYTCNRIVSQNGRILATSHEMCYLDNLRLIHYKKNLTKFINGTNSINVQQYTENRQTFLLLNQNVNIDAFDIEPTHQCTSCGNKFCVEGSEISVNLEN